jgi:hypothetical protein
VREAVFQMEHNKAPRPDGFPAEFYQVFWGWSKMTFWLYSMNSIMTLLISLASILGSLL